MRTLVLVGACLGLGMLPNRLQAQGAAAPPSIADNPGSRNVAAGATASFVVTAVGANPMTYQWQRLASGSTTWLALSDDAAGTYAGSTTPALLVAVAAGMNGDQFRCVVSNAGGSVTSGAATLSVVTATLPPTIVTQPARLVVTAGQTATLSVTATGSPAPTYQWYRGSNPIFGAITSVLRFPTAQMSDTGTYFVEVSNTYGTVTSAVVTLEVIAPVQATDYFAYSVFAGRSGVEGGVNGPALEASFRSPYGVAADPAGNLYVADHGNHLLRRIGIDGAVTTLAGVFGSGGSEDGRGNQARFLFPRGIAVDAQGVVFVADTFNHTIRRVAPDGTVTTLAGLAGDKGSADGPGAGARFNFPTGVAVDSAGVLYVADRSNFTVRRIGPDGVVTTLAGSAGVAGSADGTGAAARFDHPVGVAVDSGGIVYVVDSYNHTLRRIAPGGVVTTFAGRAGLTGSNDGVGDNARFLYPNGIAIDPWGTLAVADSSNAIIRRISPNGAVSTIGGLAGVRGSADGTGAEARFHTPMAVAFDAGGNLLVADSVLAVIRRGQYFSAPQVRRDPNPRTVMATVSASFDVVATGTGNLSYQWQRRSAGGAAWTQLSGGGAYSGVLSPTLTIASPTELMSGDEFRCLIANSLGSSTSQPARLTVTPLVIAPTIATPPTAQEVVAGQIASFSVVAAGTTPLQHRWERKLADGSWQSLKEHPVAGITGAETALLLIEAATLAMNGEQFRCVVSNSSGTATSAPALLTVRAPASRLSNLSVRAQAGGPGSALIVGFASAGTGPKSLLLRAVGPGLAAFNVPGTMADPGLRVFRSNGDALGENDDWGGTTVLADASARAGAFALPPLSRDSALLLSATPGGYTVVAEARSGGPGSVLVEAYDLDSPDAPARVTNLSARSFLSPSNPELIVGFVITGNAPRSVLIRGIGPTLAAFGVTDAVPDARLRVLGEGGSVRGENDDWGTGSGLAAAFAGVGAFPLLPGSRDAALLVALPPGSYSVMVTAPPGSSGSTLVEIYEVP